MSYPGAKGQAGVFQRIIGQMPPHDMFIELFAGSGKITDIKKPADMNFLVEKDAAQAQWLVENFEWKKRATVLHKCAFDVLAENKFRPGMLLYCDPPYLLETRRNRRYYAHEMTVDDHKKLLGILTSLDCHVMISGYPSKLYSDYLEGLHHWRCISYRTRTRGRTLTECLWCNFPEPVELHDWRFAGQTHRQRLTYKRLAARWLRRLANMPARKRGFLLNAIQQRQS